MEDKLKPEGLSDNIVLDEIISLLELPSGRLETNDIAGQLSRRFGFTDKASVEYLNKAIDQGIIVALDGYNIIELKASPTESGVASLTSRRQENGQTQNRVTDIRIRNRAEEALGVLAAMQQRRSTRKSPHLKIVDDSSHHEE